MALLKNSTYKKFFQDILHIISDSRSTFAKKLQELLVGMYWEIGRRIVEEEQQGEKRAEYGTQLIQKLSHKQFFNQISTKTNLKCPVFSFASFSIFD